MALRDRPSEETTLGSGEYAPLAETPQSVAALTIIAHPERELIGYRALLPDLNFGGAVDISRVAPRFGPPGASGNCELGDRSLSRKPLRLEAFGPDAVRLVPSTGAREAVVDGRPLAQPRVLSSGDLGRGVVVLLSSRVALLLHETQGLHRADTPDQGVSGASDAVVRLRREIAAVAPNDVPVLIRGESGVGKERVAQALHAASPRRHGPLVAVNMAAIPTAIAASALFGHVRGAFTGAHRASDGYFGAAGGGTLFLDEIGDVPPEIQPTLLRALESGEVQSVGASRPRRVDVRVVSATDRDLATGTTLRLALLQRLTGYDLHVPPLRERREDVPRLLCQFLEDSGAPVVAEGAWLPAALMADLVRYGWPGNVRELAHVANRMTIASSGMPQARLDPVLRSQLDGALATHPRRAFGEADALSRSEGPVTDEVIAVALHQADYQPSRAARLLGISRTTLYTRIADSDLLRKAADLDREQVRAALSVSGGDFAGAARALEVSERGLRLRARQLEADA